MTRREDERFYNIKYGYHWENGRYVRDGRIVKMKYPLDLSLLTLYGGSVVDVKVKECSDPDVQEQVGVKNDGL